MLERNEFDGTRRSVAYSRKIRSTWPDTAVELAAWSGNLVREAAQILNLAHHWILRLSPSFANLIERCGVCSR